MSTINRNITSSSDSEMKFINPNMRCNFAPIDNWLCKTKISSNAKMLYGRLRQFADENGVAYPKMDTLAKACGLQKRTAERALKVLKDHKLIYTVKSRMRKTNSYLFLWHPWMEEAVDPKVVEAVENDLYKSEKFKKPNVSSTPVNTTNLSSTPKTHTTNMSYVHTTNLSYLYNRRKEHIEKNMYVGTHTHSGNNVFLENPAKRSSTNLDEYNPPVHNENFIVDNQKLDDCIIDIMLN
ncbi:helix-turn-helix domain-containing protein [Candidatus Odyssella acanthamoebae]|nr:helix-turn-helix domain-containing protein [Candidatus Paracaedibacter acanthamoebae]